MASLPPDGQFSPQQTSALLASLDHSPRKPLGQNFLVDGNIVRKSLQLATITREDHVVEIGPGLGTLTAALLSTGATVHAIECDHVLARHLRQWLAPRYPGKFFLLEGNAMDFPLAGLPTTTGGAPADFKIVANLPYAISTPWVSAMLACAHHPTEMVLMLQREAAERFTASHNPKGPNKAIGAISIALSAAYASAQGHKVPPSCFLPAPQVDSFLLHLHRHPQPRFLLPATMRVIRTLFLHRRKQLGKLLKSIPPTPALNTWREAWPQLGVSPILRPEEIPFPVWYALDCAFAATSQGENSHAETFAKPCSNP
jgi:16S rRNA (adenine1518-N6/adenine1519-N6)-dimethyltransferase